MMPISKKIIPLTALLLTGGLVFAQQGTAAFGLDQAVQYALQHNTAIKNAQLNVADAQEQIVERRATGLPQLSGGVNYQYYVKIPVQPLPENFRTFGVVFNDLMPYLSESTRELLMQQNQGGDSDGIAFFLRNNLTASLNLDAMIFDGSYFVGLQAARAFRRYVSQELLTREREVRNKVIDAYFPVLLVDKNLEILERNAANVGQLLFETGELFKAGFAEQLDVDRLELSLTNLRTEQDNLRRQREVALSALKFAMNYPLDQELNVTGDLESMLTEAPEEILTGDVNYARRPETALIEQALELNRLNVRLNKSGYLPTLRAFGTYQQSYFGNNLRDGFWAPATFVGFNLNVPIFDGLEKKARIQRAQLDLEEVQNQQSDLRQSIQLEVKNARTNYLNAKGRLESQQKNLELAERIYRTTQIKYREGVGSSLEVSQAEQSLYNTQQNYMQALYDLVVARADLEQALGN